MAKNINEANKARFDKLVFELEKAEAEYEDVSVIHTDEESEFRDGVAYLMVPESFSIPKPLMHTLYVACFGSDETRFMGSKNTFVFTVKDIYPDRPDIPGVD